MSARFDDVRSLLDEAVASGVTPALVLETGSSVEPRWRYAAGRLTYDAGAPAASERTIFDLASLTKVIVTASLGMRHVERGTLPLATRVAARVPEWLGRDRAGVTVRDLLEHCSGLPAWVPLFVNNSGREQFQPRIAAQPLDYPPWTRAVYSDLGFMLLGFVLEDAGGAPLDEQFASLDFEGLFFRPPVSLRPLIAPTRDDPWRERRLVGEVDDDNAWALGGVAGHAGLFGDAAAVGAFARTVLQTFNAPTRLCAPATLARFVTRSTVPGSSRALGWDTRLPTSSCGTRLSPRAIGHTGFTGTSLWIDPARDLYVVLLSNRVHPTPKNDRVTALRPQVHDAVVRAVE